MLSPILRKIAVYLTFMGLLFAGLIQVSPALAASTVSVGSKPSAIIADNSGNFYVSNYGDGTITKIDAQGQPSIYANLSSVNGKATAFALDSNGLLYASVYSGQIYKVAADGTLTEFAKAGRKPVAMIFDKNGNLYTANNLDNTVSKITSAGVVTKFATVGGQPDGLVFDANGNLYSVNSLDNTVSKITSAGVTSNFATVGNIPMGITADSTGNIFVVNSDDNTVSKITSAGVVSTFATVGKRPMAIAIDSDNSLYTNNYLDGTITKVTNTGQVSTYAITGSGPLDIAINRSKTVVTSNYLAKSVTIVKTSDVRAAAPKNLATSKSTSTTVDLTWDTVENSSEYYLEAITDSGTTLTTSARTGSTLGSFTLGGLCSKKSYQLKVYSVNSAGLGTASSAATITMPTGAPGAPQNLLLTALTGTTVGLAWDAPDCDGGAAISDYRISYSSDGGTSWNMVSHSASTLTEITATGLVLGRNYIFKVAAVNSSGVGVASGYAYASTSTTQATYTVGASPSTMVLDSSGNVYVANSGEPTITKITSKGVVSKFATVAENPTAMVFDSAGNLYVANSGSDNISKVTPAGVSTIFATVDDGPSALIFDSAGNLYSSNSLAATISKITPAGVVSTFAALPTNSYDLAIDGQGNIYTANGNNFSMYKITPQGEVSVFARLTVAAKRLTSDGSGNFFVYNVADKTIQKVTTSGVVTDFITLDDPITDLFIDKKQNFFIANNSYGSVSRIDSNNNLTTIAIFDNTVNRIVLDSAGYIFTSFLENSVSKNYLGVVPTAPKNLASSALTSTSVNLAWSAPDSDGGSALVDYRVEQSVDSGSTWSALVRSVSTSASFGVTGLSPGKNYQFRVFALNGLGSSIASNVVTVNTPAVVATAPKNLSTSSISAAGMLLGWQAPDSDGGAAITDYKIEISADNGSSWNTISHAASANTSIPLSNLLSAKAYKLRVSAINSVGTGALSSVVTTTTLATTPDAPRTLQLGSITGTSMQLSWLAPTSNGGSSITDYRIETSTDNGSSWSSISRSVSTALNYNVTGLTPATAYRYRVTAINSVGAGTVSSVVAGTTLAVSPNSPKTLVASEVTFNSVQLSWQSPDYDGGSSITDYKLEISGDGKSFAIVRDQVSTQTGYTVTGLTPNSQYSFRVTAINSVGSSQASDLLTVTTNSTVASSPRSVSASQITSTGLQLNWVAPISNGGQVISDYQIEFSTDSGASWSLYQDQSSIEVSRTVNGLVPATSYSFRITAINSVGLGISSGTVSATTLATIPTAPVGLQTTQVTFNSIQLAWLAPEYNGGSNLTDYKLEVSLDSGLTWDLVKESVSTNTNYTVNGLNPVSNYLFRVSALNRIGLGPASETLSVNTPATMPSAPLNVSDVDLKYNSLTLVWDQPESDGGSTISDYKIEILKAGTWSEISHSPSIATSISVTDLLPLTSYSFRVTAINGIGSSPTSIVYKVSTIASRAPKAPAVLNLTNFRSTSVSLQWEAANSELPITGYVIDYSTNGVTWKNAPTLTPFSLTGSISSLSPATTYTIRVAAINREGRGEFVYSSFTTSSVAPSAPTGLTATSISGTSFVLNWNKPANDGGSAITNYIVEINGGVFTWTQITKDPSNQTTLLISNLKPGVQYAVRVKAVNAIGSSAVSKSLNVKTSAVLPAAPTGLVVKKVTKNSAIISWNPANSGGSAITDYILEYSTDSGKTWTKVSRSPSTATNITLKTLRSKTRYVIRVSSRNSQGTSQASSIISLTTL